MTEADLHLRRTEHAALVVDLVQTGSDRALLGVGVTIDVCGQRP